MIRPYFETDLGKLYSGDCLEILKQLPDKHIQCCITSPPYWGLRDYGTAEWVGGDSDCEHIAGVDNPRSSRPLGKFHGGNDQYHVTPYLDHCRKCGAKRVDQQIGLEKTPQEYVSKLVALFGEVKRVLKDNGTVWLNLGDTYAAARSYQVVDNKYKDVGNKIGHLVPPGLKPKDLVGIPWRVAFALQADGWYLRQDIIWRKLNPMPESVRDRCTKAHEYIFLLSKKQKYYYDAEAVREKANYDGRQDTRLKGSTKYKV